MLFRSAFAEAERYLPQLLDKLDAVIRAHGLAEAGILLRMTGCPNGCARPYQFHSSHDALG